MDVRTYGSLTIRDGVWYLRAEPHVTIRIKRIFPRMSPTAQGVLAISDTLDVCRDLDWLTGRWPLRIPAGDSAYLASRVQRALANEQVLREIQDGRRLASPDWLETTVPPRGYQLGAADVVLATGRRIVVHGIGMGKAQPLTSQVLTPTGFRAMGDLAVGDAVVAADGTASTITGVHEQGVLDCWDVQLSDGAVVRCNDDHLWAVRSHRSPDAPVHVRSLRDLLAAGLRTPQGQARWHIPLAQPADLEHPDPLPLDPYLVGVLLGDGSLTGASAGFSSVDQQVIDQVAAGLPPGVDIQRNGQSIDYRLVERGPRTGRQCTCGRPAVARGLCGRCYQRAVLASAPLPAKQGARAHQVLDPLRVLGMWGHGAFTKRVPTRYLHAPAKDRLALLQGLMDTDGTAQTDTSRHRGCVLRFSSASRQLADDVQWLARSLGGTARSTTTRKGGKPHHYVTLKMPAGVIPFRLSRKAERLISSTTTAPTHAIVSAEHVGREPMRCISIAHPDRLYVTDDFVTTHNTYTGYLVLREPKARPAMVATLGGVLPEQWVAQLRKFFPQLTAAIAPTGEITDKVRDRLLTADVVVVPYSRLAKYQPLLQGHVRTTIYDEVQELRHAGTQKYIAAQAISSEAAYRMGLTGTLIYGYAGEVWDITEVHEPGALGDKTEFTREWGGVTASGGNLSIADAGPLGEYMREQGLMEVKSRADVGMPVNEPDIQEYEVDVDEAVIDDARRDVAKIAQAIIERQGTRQEQFAWEREMDWRMREATGRAKAPGVAELVRLILDGQQRVLLFGWHHSVYGIWMRELAEFNPVRFTGAESPRQKADNLRAFSRDARVCMMSVRAGAGIDGLQEHCSALVIGELDWSPGVHLQNIGRLDRDGQTQPVFGFIATTQYGSDPLVTEVLGMKKREDNTLMGVALSKEPTLSNTDRVLRMARDVLDRRQPTRPHPAAEGAAAE